MASLDPTERAKIQLAADDQLRISTSGQCTVQGLTGAPLTTATLTASSQDFGPYGVSAVLLVTGVSGRTDYSLNNAEYTLTATEKRAFDSLVSGDGIRTLQSAVTPQRKAITRALPQSLGTLVCDWSISPVGTASTTDAYPVPIWPVPAVPQCNGAGGAYYASAVSGSESSEFQAIGLWAKASTRADGQPYTYARLNLGTDNTFANRALCAMTLRADGVWRYYVLPKALWGTSGTFTLGSTTFSHVQITEAGAATALTLTGSLVAGATTATLNANFSGTTEVYPVRFSSGEVRLALLTNGSTAVKWGGALTASATTAIVYATTRLAAQTGDLIAAGPVYRNPQGRALAMVRFDDGTLDQYVPRITLATPYVGQSGVTIPSGTPLSGASIVAAFGVRATAYILTRLVGNTAQNFLTAAQLRDLQDTYGWTIGFQTHQNPISVINLGGRLLGQYGYNYAACAYGSISGVAANVVTTANAHRITNTSGQAGIQGFAAEIIGPTPPATTLTVGQQVWLRPVTTTTFTIHLTEADSVANTNIVTLDTGGTSWGFRCWGSTDSTAGIASDFATGQALMQGWGLNGWRHVALNQGGWDLPIESVALPLIANGNIRTVQGTFGASGTANATFMPRPVFATQSGGVGFVGGNQQGGTIASWLNGSISIGTEAVTEANIRAAVDAAITRGGIISNYHHFFADETSARQLIAYCDALKLRQDQGLLQVVSPDELWAMTQDAGAL